MSTIEHAFVGFISPGCRLIDNLQLEYLSSGAVQVNACHSPHLPGPINVQEDCETVVQKEVSICIVMAVKT